MIFFTPLSFFFGFMTCHISKCCISTSIQCSELSTSKSRLNLITKTLDLIQFSLKLTSRFPPVLTQCVGIWKHCGIFGIELSDYFANYFWFFIILQNCCPLLMYRSGLGVLKCFSKQLRSFLGSTWKTLLKIFSSFLRTKLPLSCRLGVKL